MESIDTRLWDVIVVGAGPAGSMAALAAAQFGASVLLIERHMLPRDKLCGGGLIGTSLASLPDGFVPPERDRTSAIMFTRNLEHAEIRTSDGPFITMINRAEFDAGLAACSVRAGTHLAEGVRVDDVEQDVDEVRLRTDRGTLRARSVVGADGSASRIARHVGAAYAQVDLGLEVQVHADDATRARYRGLAALDFGGPPGAYAWVFPKDDTLTVGAIAAKGFAVQQRSYLDAFIKAQGLAHLPSSRAEGHLTRCRVAGAPLGRGRVLLAGDAAGLLEPWTREGISFALRSGRLAGAAAAAGALGAAAPVEALDEYAAAVEGSLGAEMTVGSAALRAFTRHPALFSRAITSDRGWRAFVRLSLGETTLARAARHRVVRVALNTLAI